MPWSAFKEFGLVGLMCAAIIYLLFLVVKWTLATTRDILKQAEQERASWIKAFSEHTEQAKLFHQSVTEAHNYQREEHEKFQEKLNDHCNATKLVCENLSQVREALGRINGYTHEPRT